MSAPIQTAALIFAGVSVAACSLSGFTFDLAGSGGAAATTTTSSTASGSGGSEVTASSTSSGESSVCGDGVLEGSEECDDSNLAFGDGCSPTCMHEALDACPGALIPLTPKGLTIAGTLADKELDLTPSCGAGTADVVYAVVPSVGGTLSAERMGEGQGTVSIRSSCADSFTSELVCKQGSSPTAQVWVQPGVTYWVVVSGGNETFTLNLKLFACGDGQVQGLEQCDNPADTKCIGCTRCNDDAEFRDATSKHCYLVSPLAQKSWTAARAACIAWGGDLAAIRSQAELDFIKSKVPFGNNWIGGTDVTSECAFSWTNGEPWHAKWESGQPDNADGIEDCVVLSNQNGTMNDLACSNGAGYLCERAPAGTCGDGVVQPGEECDDAIVSTTFDCQACKLTCKAGEFQDPATRHCYRVVTNHVSPINAASACATLGAYVAAINTPAENALIAAKLTEATWIGLGSAAPNTSAWSNSDPFCFLNFKNGSGSSKLCTTMSTDGTWTNASCTGARAYVCERDN